MKTIHIKLCDCPVKIIVSNTPEQEMQQFHELTVLCMDAANLYNTTLDLIKSHKKTFEICAARRNLCKRAYAKKIPMYAIAEFLGIDVGGVKHYLKGIQ